MLLGASLGASAENENRELNVNIGLADTFESLSPPEYDLNNCFKKLFISISYLPTGRSTVESRLGHATLRALKIPS